MKIGIVGHEAAKFTAEKEQAAKRIIHQIMGAAALNSDHKTLIGCSGHCHLGGIDIWAEEIFPDYCSSVIYPPKSKRWDDGYKQRNIQIAEFSDVVHVIVVSELPPEYMGMRFRMCYHCVNHPTVKTPEHVKSGGCWTAHYARGIGKQAVWHVI